jgi:archaellum biogenesis ATPase FlaH
MQKDLEARLLSLLATKPEAFGQVIQYGISSDSFVSLQEIFNFIQTYNHKYNCIPSLDLVKSNFNEDFFVKDVKDDELKYLSDELLRTGVARKAIGLVNKYQDLLLTDTYGAIDALSTQLAKIRKPATLAKSLTDKDALKRLTLMKARKEALGKGLAIGIKTGISAFDRNFYGWQYGNFALIVGRPKVGKSWLLQYLGGTAYQSGKRVLYISPEMNTDEVDLRFDTLMGKMNGYTFLNDQLSIGNIDLVKYETWLKKLSQRHDWITFDSNNGLPFTAASISALVDEYSPDVVLVDGIYLINGSGGSDWERVKGVAYDIKSMAQSKKIVALGATQASKAAGTDVPDPSQAAYSDALIQAADIGIMMAADQENSEIRYITIPLIRGHQAINKRMIVKFDVNKGVIEV